MILIKSFGFSTDLYLGEGSIFRNLRYQLLDPHFTGWVCITSRNLGKQNIVDSSVEQIYNKEH